MKRIVTFLATLHLVALCSSPSLADPLTCDMNQYRAQPGLAASASEDSLLIEWNGEARVKLSMRFAIDNATPLVAELAIRKGDEEWTTLAQGLTPEFHVTSGMRRISYQQLNPLRSLGLGATREFVEKEKWNVFWDAPLNIPGVEGINPDLPRLPHEIRRADASFRTQNCHVRTNGARLEITFDGVSLGVFSGELRFTVYQGANLVRMEAIAQTDEPSIAYKYRAGFRGFRTDATGRVVWRDTGGDWQKCEFGGAVNEAPVALRARNRLAVVETDGGSLAVFPPPHKFFWAREIDLNLGYVWYRKDTDRSFSVGVRHGDREEMFRPYGVSDSLWEKRVNQARRFAQGNFALYNAPPGTQQRMAVYFYLCPDAGEAAQRGVMALTHNDRYKPLPGYKVAVSHFHTHFHEQVMDVGSFDFRPPWISAFRALGINIAMMSDFHGDGHPRDPGPIRLREQQAYFEACRRHSDRDFLIMPGEEPNTYFGGHYTMIFPRPVYWTKKRGEGQTFAESHPVYGTVYHIGSADDELRMLRQESGLVWQAHPRTKGSTGYPDAIRESTHFRSDRFLGAAFQSLPADLSHARLGEVRCFGTLDDMNNWAGPKYLVAEGDTYTKYPENEIYSGLAVNYVKLDSLPRSDGDWSPITEAMRKGHFFVTTGEVLIRHFAVQGAGKDKQIIVDVEWTFPLAFVEVVWGDGETTRREIVSATHLPPLSSHHFTIPFDSAGKKWVRVAIWDSAGNGSFTQPVHLNRT